MNLIGAFYIPIGISMFVLVIENHSYLLDSLTDDMTMLGYETVGYDTVYKALTDFNGHIDLLLCDSTPLSEERWGGARLLEKLLDKHPSAQLLLYSVCNHVLKNAKDVLEKQLEIKINTCLECDINKNVQKILGVIPNAL